MINIYVAVQIILNNFFFQTVTLGEVLSPFIMMLVLSIVHSQIVSTTTISKKNFLKTPRSHSPRNAKRGHSTSSKIKIKSKLCYCVDDSIQCINLA